MTLRRICTRSWRQSTAGTFQKPANRGFSAAPACGKSSKPSLTDHELAELLSKPTWSVRSLLPPSAPDASSSASPKVTPKQLRHLLRLSALPEPRDAGEEFRMLETLSSQLHFVQVVQQVDTIGVAPLRSLRDETEQGDKQNTFNLRSMRDALEEEEVVGKHHKRIRRKPLQDADGKTRAAEDWNVLGHSQRKVGKFFVVEGAPSEE